ncbi:hypothetical protein ABFS83_06G200200 [Erythranthe nasuta]
MKAERIECNDDLLTELLLLLPPKSVFRFMSVSKRWNNIIKNPYFLKNYTIKRRRRGVHMLAFIQRTFIRCKKQIQVVPICVNISDSIKGMIGRFGRFFNPSGGLILCSSGPTMYTVFNPATARWAPLPPASPRNEELYSSLDGFSCVGNTDELTPNYTVVRVCHRVENTIIIETFSSTTGEWALSTLAAARTVERLYTPPVVAGGVFHWLVTDRSVAVYDPNDRDGGNHLRLIQLPIIPDFFTYIIIARSPQDNMLWFGTVKLRRLKLWKLEDKGEGGTHHTSGGGDEWDLKYDVCLEPLYKSPEDIIKNDRWDNFYLMCEPGSVVSWDPLVVLIMTGGVWFLYNLDTESGEVIDGCFSSGDGGYSGSVYPFYESSFLSSYAL